MSLTMRIVKELMPPLVYRYAEKMYNAHRCHKINATGKFANKIFCIGFNKTGTTSVESVLHDFGFSLGNQSVAETLLPDWYKQDYARLIRYCQTAQAFQDIPFSLPQTYHCLDEVFPDAKFILTIRDSEDQWFKSLLKFHTKWFSSDKNRAPTKEDMENSLYCYKGYMLDIMEMVYGYPKVELYDYKYYTGLYQRHNDDVTEYFRNRPGKLLTLNVSSPKAYQELAAFLNVSVSSEGRFPWKNKT